ncbi:uncharacterized protein TRIADDRAFT_54553 [Trichoplax adhaerens]|uniref:DNA-directed RNA polymerase III subunit n=1 Tax=Trichoplax adhaerens TaxID=10228 RepID=B3RSC8_TRIAD|nr:hypothetical protein TRIADDRAFT_54553 [Trichoplax adhaerens]EDV26492.1 hypothetical protein TRIADDRAFT_54553 [Trichoplax adhaerens]|eukprot:XP_002110488.1 hypothetical protein TRIADDRAFT_54553 [Trichoplax adhaerens]
MSKRNGPRILSNLSKEAIPVSSKGNRKDDVLVQPPPLYPKLECLPVPCNKTKIDIYINALKNEFRETLRESPYYIRARNRANDIRRYSDRYRQNCENISAIPFKLCWKDVPKELRISRRIKKVFAAPISVRHPSMKSRLSRNEIDHLEKLTKIEEMLEKEEEEDHEKQQELEDEWEEEDQDEETDYNLTYFDNGEDYGFQEDDDLDNEATY